MERKDVKTDMNELSKKVEGLEKQISRSSTENAKRFEKMEQAILELVKMQMTVAHLLKDNDKRDEATKELTAKVNNLEKDVNANSQTLSWTERFFWIVVSAGVWLIGKNILWAFSKPCSEVVMWSKKASI